MLGYAEKKKKAMLAVLFIFSGLLLGTLQTRTADAVTITITKVFSSLIYDGWIYRTGPYDEARNAQTGYSIQNSSIYLNVGQRQLITQTYIIERAFLFFDTSIIPNDVNITNAILSLYVYTTPSSHFEVVIQNGQPTYPHMPLQLGDYYYGWYSGIGGSRHTSTMPSSGYWNITFNSDGLNWIQKNGITKLCLRSDKDINGVPPTGSEIAVFYAVEQGEAYAPKLYVTYEVEGYRYILHGPYRENGSVANQAINVTVEVEHVGYYVYTLNGSDGAADTFVLEFESRVLSICWSASSVYINTSRTIIPRHDLKFEEFWLYVPDTASEWADIYTFNILDLAGINWGYLEAWQTIGNQHRLIERMNILGAFEINFYLIIGRTYTLRVVTNLGTATIGSFTIKPADRQYNIILTPNMFPPPPFTLTPTCNASRVNATYITATYCNPNMTATWVYYEIKHRTGQTWQTDYSLNCSLSGMVDTLNWYKADQTTDYVLDVKDSLGNVWTFSLPAPPRTVNPWAGLDSLWLDSPVRFSQIVGVLIVLMVLGVFSYEKAEAGLFAAWATAAVLYMIGWLETTYTLLMFALAIVIFAVIQKAKREVEV